MQPQTLTRNSCFWGSWSLMPQLRSKPMAQSLRSIPLDNTRVKSSTPYPSNSRIPTSFVFFVNQRFPVTLKRELLLSLHLQRRFLIPSTTLNNKIKCDWEYFLNCIFHEIQLAWQRSGWCWQPYGNQTGMENWRRYSSQEENLCKCDWNMMEGSRSWM